VAGEKERTVPRTVLPAQGASVAVARRFVADVLTNRDFQTCVERAVLLTSELLTSAVVTSNSHVELVVLADHPMVRVEVHLGDVPIELDVSADNHYRSELLTALSESWGVERTSPRRQVAWFEVRA
jgi:hypothetical protein